MTKIKWASLGLGRGETWNPIRALAVDTFKPGWPAKIGWHCEKVSPAYENCYAERQNIKPGASGGTGFPYKPGHRQNRDIEIYLDDKTLLAPLHWREPRGIFVCSMTDIFADFVTDEMRDRVFAVAILTPHRYAFLTKRAARQRAYMSDPATPKRVWAEVDKIIERWDSGDAGFKLRCIDDDPKLFALATHGASWGGERPWPPKNTWHGVTAEDQRRAEEHIPDLLATPAAVRFVSIEPMLGAVDLRNVKSPRGSYFDALDGLIWGPNEGRLTTLGWVICGGESGPGARPMHPDWARSLRDQCKAAGVPLFFKQWGEWVPHSPQAGGDLGGDLRSGRVQHVCADRENDGHYRKGDAYMASVGKARAGRLLDGREHSEFPEAK